MENSFSSRTQISWVCDALLSGRKISVKDQLNESWGWRLPAIIHQLRTSYKWDILIEIDEHKIAHYQINPEAEVLNFKSPASYLRDLKRGKND